MGNANIRARQKPIISQYIHKCKQLTLLMQSLTTILILKPNSQTEQDIICREYAILSILRDLSDLDKQIIQYNQQLNQTKVLEVDTQLSPFRQAIEIVKSNVVPKFKHDITLLV